MNPLSEFLVPIPRDIGFVELGQALAGHPLNRDGMATTAIFALATWFPNNPTTALHCSACYDGVQDNPVRIGRRQQVGAVWLVSNADQQWTAQPVCLDCCPSEQAAVALAPRLVAPNPATTHPSEMWTGTVTAWDWNPHREMPSR